MHKYVIRDCRIRSWLLEFCTWGRWIWGHNILPADIQLNVMWCLCLWSCMLIGLYAAMKGVLIYIDELIYETGKWFTIIQCNIQCFMVAYHNTYFWEGLHVLGLFFTSYTSHKFCPIHHFPGLQLRHFTQSCDFPHLFLFNTSKSDWKLFLGMVTIRLHMFWSWNDERWCENPHLKSPIYGDKQNAHI